MLREFLIIIGRRLFGRPRKRALCPVATRFVVRASLLLMIVVTARTSFGSVLANGSVVPFDNPFPLQTTTGPYFDENEGLPPDGNVFNQLQLPNQQTQWEGRQVTVSGGAPPFTVLEPQFYTNVNFPVIVGLNAYGVLLIDGESALRDLDLIIGSSQLIGTQTRIGTGVVRITGIGSLYNNDWRIPPPFISAVPTFQSVRPRSLDDPDGEADLYVGREGNGTLDITAGGRAEISDAIIVAATTASVGVINVDGVDSFLGNGGFSSNAASSNVIHQMAIGLSGNGAMNITNGGTVAVEAPTVPQAGSVAGTTIGRIGAVIGGVPSEVITTNPPAGGSGTVTVSSYDASGNAGPTSKWIIGGALQVGGFALGTVPVGNTTLGDIEGDDAVYANEAGRGTLNVLTGGLVSIHPAQNANQDEALVLAIGRFGRVNMGGGQITITNANAVPGQPSASTDEVQIINDGVIDGGGKIETGVFRNRYQGEVRVHAGQKLIIDSSSQFVTGGTAAAQTPLINFGLIEVVGTQDQQAEFEVVRALPTLPPGLAAIGNTFINRPLAQAPPTPPFPRQTTFDGGLISVQWGTLRFNSGAPAPGGAALTAGLLNEGVVAFTAGTNIIDGFLLNSLLVSPGTAPLAPVVLIGPDTTVVVEDDFTNAWQAPDNIVPPPPLPPVPRPIVDIRAGATLIILDQGTFTTSGVLKLTLDDSSSSVIQAAGEIGLGGNVEVSLTSDMMSSLTHGSTFNLISFGTQAYHVNATGADVDPTRPILPGGSGFTGLSVAPDISLLHPALDPIVHRSGQSMYLSFLDPAIIGASGPDFNGDQFVNSLDLSIWQANVGITFGASVLQGDADSDGDVDGDDFLAWQSNIGPWSGAGGGSGAGLGAPPVPEPASLTLLVVGASATAFRRRRP